MKQANDSSRIKARADGCHTRDWNPWSEKAQADPAAIHADLRSRCPFPYAEILGGFRSITRYADIVEAALDTEHFKNGLRPKLSTPMLPLESDPPEHMAYRRLLKGHFSPGRMRIMEDQLRSFAVKLLDPLIAKGKADFAIEFSHVLPVRAFCYLLNLPDEDWQTIKQWSMDAFVVFAHVPERRANYESANKALYEYARRMLADRRVNPRDPADDIVTRLAQASMNEKSLDDEVIVSIMRLLLTAGHESTASGLGNCLLFLARSQDAQVELRANPSGIPAAIEEILRWDTPVMAMPRIVAKKVELGGHQFEAGECVNLLYASGNRDSNVFDDADKCDIKRRDNPHLAFGYGIHKCIGAPLARVEIKVALEELLARTERFTLDGEPVRTIFHRRGVSSLPLKVTAANGSSGPEVPLGQRAERRR